MKIADGFATTLFVIVTATGALQVGHMWGVRDGVAQEKAAASRETAAAQTATDTAAAALQAKIDKLAGQATQTENARQTAARENRNASQPVLARPVYSTVCVDADGVQLLDQAADIANGHASGESLALPAGLPGLPAKAATH